MILLGPCEAGRRHSRRFAATPVGSDSPTWAGSAATTSESHVTRYEPPGIPHTWPGDPRVNIRNDKGMAKAYQFRQVIRAIEKLEAQGD